MRVMEGGAPVTSPSKKRIIYAVQHADVTLSMRGPYLLLKGFDQKKWSTEIVSIQSPLNQKIDKFWGRVPLTLVRGRTKWGKLLKLSLTLLLRRKDHLVVSWIWWWHCYALMIAKILRGAPYVIALDTYPHRASYQGETILTTIRLELRYGLILRYANLIIAESPFSFMSVKKVLPESNVIHIPVCLWLQDLESIEAQWSEKHRSLERQYMILYAGRIAVNKNLHVLLAAFGGLADRYPDWKLEIIGPVSDKNYLLRLREKIGSLGLGERVRFEPPRQGEQLYFKYRTSAIFCLPSKGEGMPTAVLEAMYFGGAIIAADSGSVGYLLDEGNCGLLCKPNNEIGLIKCMDKLMGSEKERMQLIRSARLRMTENFVWERYFDRVETSFNSILNE